MASNVLYIYMSSVSLGTINVYRVIMFNHIFLIDIIMITVTVQNDLFPRMAPLCCTLPFC